MSGGRYPLIRVEQPSTRVATQEADVSVKSKLKVASCAQRLISNENLEYFSMFFIYSLVLYFFYMMVGYLVGHD